MRLERDSYGIPVLNKDGIESLAERFLQRTLPRVLANPISTPLSDIFAELGSRELCTFSFDDTLGETEDGQKCLGYYSLSRRHVAIDSSLTPSDVRFAFTCAHELGHFYLHSKVDPAAIMEHAADEIRDSSVDIVTFRIDGSRPRTRVEWQANRFAAALLIPRRTLPKALDEVQIGLGISRRGRLWLDHQRQNQQDYRNTLARIATMYSVSKSVVRFRLRDLGLLHEHHSYAPRAVSETLEAVLQHMFQA